MSDRDFDIETVVLTREYLETVHGRMSFADADEGEEASLVLASDTDGNADQPLAG